MMIHCKKNQKNIFTLFIIAFLRNEFFDNDHNQTEENEVVAPHTNIVEKKVPPIYLNQKSLEIKQNKKIKLSKDDDLNLRHVFDLPTSHPNESPEELLYLISEHLK